MPKLDDDEEALQHRDGLFWARKLTEGFDNTIAMEFNPSWLARVDEIMVSFLNAH